MNENERDADDLAAKFWRELMTDIATQPCSYPDLRDGIWDWLRNKKLDLEEAHRRLLEQTGKIRLADSAPVDISPV